MALTMIGLAAQLWLAPGAPWQVLYGGVLLATIANAVTGSFYEPSALVAVRTVVPADRLGRAMAFQNSASSGARLLGPVLSAGLMAIGGFAAAVFANALTFVVALLFVRAAGAAHAGTDTDTDTGTTTGPGRTEPPVRRSFRRDLREGIASTVRDRYLVLIRFGSRLFETPSRTLLRGSAPETPAKGSAPGPRPRLRRQEARLPGGTPSQHPASPTPPRA